MQSELLVEYMRTGTIAPLVKGDTKCQVETKLGPPDDWKGRIAHIGWEGSTFADFRDSWAWHYGSLCVTFPDPQLYGLPGISLDYTSGSDPIHFPPPFEGIPETNFTIRELIDLLRTHEVLFEDFRPDAVEGLVVVTEGGVAAAASGGNCSPRAQIIYLFPHEFACA